MKQLKKDAGRLTRDQFIEMHQSMTRRELEEHLGVSESAIRTMIRRFKAPRKMTTKPELFGPKAIDGARRLYRSGKTYAQIADILGCHKNTVAKWAQAGAWLRPNLSQEKARALYENGMSPKDIGAQVGRTAETIRRWARSLGWVSPEDRNRVPDAPIKILAPRPHLVVDNTPPKIEAAPVRQMSLVPHSDRFTGAMDAMLRRDGGTYAARAVMADMWGLPIGAVTLRWHAVR